MTPAAKTEPVDAEPSSTSGGRVWAGDEREPASRPSIDIERWSLLAEAVLGEIGVAPDAELNLSFVDEASMAELNETHMGSTGPTDVLAFPIDDEDPPPGVPILLGDVVICPTVAERNAPDHAGTLDDEIALLVVHGILHVMGMDHADPAETEQMQARERALLATHHRGES